VKTKAEQKNNIRTNVAGEAERGRQASEKKCFGAYCKNNGAEKKIGKERNVW